MREIPLSNCEREFLLKAISEKRRIDGRECYDYRDITITFGVDRGCCSVELGKTRVMCQVSCELTTPKQSRPSEGMLFVNVELSPMCAPQFDPGRQSDQCVEITRILERCIKESRCVDTESLCVMSGLKVWSIRCDIHVLNHDGNVIDCASIAAISSLVHFRRPDVSVCGEEITVHSTEDRDPIPLSVHHMPLCVTFGFYKEGKFLLVDPLEKEERVMDGKMVIGMNKHREICSLQMAGSMLLLKDQVLRCSNIAVVKVTEITELIQRALHNDTQARAKGEKFGFAASIKPQKVTSAEKASKPVVVDSSSEAESIQEIEDEMETVNISDSNGGDNDSFECKIIRKEPGTMTIGEGGANTWDVIEVDSMEEELNEEIKKEVKGHEKVKGGKGQRQREDSVVISDGDSEEEEVVILQPQELITSSVDADSAPPTGTAKPKGPPPTQKPSAKGDLSAALKNYYGKKGKKS